MAKNLSDNLAELFSMYRMAISNDDAFNQIVMDAASFLGNCRIDTKDGEWKAARGFKVTTKDSRTVNLPPNSSYSILYHFALRIKEICQAGEMVANISIPKPAIAQVEKTIALVNTPEYKAKLKAKREEEAKKKSSDEA